MQAMETSLALGEKIMETVKMKKIIKISSRTQIPPETLKTIEIKLYSYISSPISGKLKACFLKILLKRCIFPRFVITLFKHSLDAFWFHRNHPFPGPSISNHLVI